MRSTLSSAPQRGTAHDMRCIVHLDMDCFYAQVEAVRLGIDCRTTPLVLSQWDLLIAVNYPARALGIQRGLHSAADAVRLCPDVVVALSPSYRIGETETQYHPHPTRDCYKISLEPYRHASRQIFGILRSEPGVEVEKAGVDEAYIDVTEAAQRELEELRAAAAGGCDVALDPLRDVMAPSTRLIDDRRDEMEAWFAQHGTSLAAVFDAPMRALLRGECGRGVGGSRGFCVDAADADYTARCLLLCAASRVVLRLRQRIYAELHYDCSAGIAHNRVLAKCISATHKPNQQTLLLPDRGASALFDLPLSRLRGFGGKFGAAVSAVCGGATAVRELWLVPMAQLHALDGTAVEVSEDDDDGGGGGEGGGGERRRIYRAKRAREGEGDDVDDDHHIRLRKPAQPFSGSTRGGAADEVEDGGVAHDTSTYAYYRMRGLAEDVVLHRPLSKSLIASKAFGFHTTAVETVRQWVIVLCGELSSRYEDFTALYGLRGRNWNVKLGNEGFRRMGGVLNHTVAPPDVVQPEILVAVTMREIQACCTTPSVCLEVDSVTLTIGSFVHDGSASAAASGTRTGHRQQTLHAFFAAAGPHVRASAAPPAATLPVIVVEDEEAVADGGIVGGGSCVEVADSDVVSLSASSQAVHSVIDEDESSVEHCSVSSSATTMSPLLHNPSGECV